MITCTADMPSGRGSPAEVATMSAAPTSDPRNAKNVFTDSPFEPRDQDPEDSVERQGHAYPECSRAQRNVNCVGVCAVRQGQIRADKQRETDNDSDDVFDSAFHCSRLQTLDGLLVRTIEKFAGGVRHTECRNPKGDEHAVAKYLAGEIVVAIGVWDCCKH